MPSNDTPQDGPTRRSLNDRARSQAPGPRPQEPRREAPTTSGTAKPGWKRTEEGPTASHATGQARSTRATPSGKGKGKAKKGYKGRPYVQPNRFWNYPRPNKGPIHKWLPSWRFVLGTTFTFLALGVGVFAYLYATVHVPEPEDVALAQTSKVYYADGTTEMGKFAEVNREIVDATTLPDYVGNAIVASEDRRFYSNAGIDPVGLARALWNNLQGKPLQGGSTITQQYVERYYTGQTSGYADKVREVILALKIDRQQSKQEILGNYMNTIYFGRGANGIEAAAQAYFGKSAKDLSVSESAMIAGIIPSPSRWDPAVDAEKAQQRWQRTLDLMLEGGFITQAQHDEAVFPQTIERAKENTYAGPTGYLLDSIRAELRDKVGLSDAEIDNGGLRIVSTIDPRLQELAVQSAQNIPEGHDPGLKVGLVSMDPNTGAVVAMYGGPDFLTQPRNAVTQDRAQGGSTFKPFTLLAALDQGISLNETFPSKSPMDFTVDGQTFPVRNFDRVDRGTINLIQATENSVNTVYTQLNLQVGPENTKEMAIRMGVPEDTPGLEANPVNVLGSASPHPIDMVRAYSTIASGGVRPDTHFVTSVATADGTVTYTAPTAGTQVFSKDVAASATYAMQQVVQQGTGKTAKQIGRPAAGKTGSSQDYKSAWFVGFVPQLTTAVAMYQVGPDGTEQVITPFGGQNPIAGGTFPTTIWTNYMKQAVEGLPVEKFPDLPKQPKPQNSQAPATPSQAPATEAPTTEAPTTEAPPTQEPTTEAPPTQAPTTEAPTTPAPTTPPPTTTPPATPSPTPTKPGNGNGAPGNGGAGSTPTGG